MQLESRRDTRTTWQRLNLHITKYRIDCIKDTVCERSENNTRLHYRHRNLQHAHHRHRIARSQPNQPAIDISWKLKWYRPDYIYFSLHRCENSSVNDIARPLRAASLAFNAWTSIQLRKQCKRHFSLFHYFPLHASPHLSSPFSPCVYLIEYNIKCVIILSSFFSFVVFES